LGKTGRNGEQGDLVARPKACHADDLVHRDMRAPPVSVSMSRLCTQKPSPPVTSRVNLSGFRIIRKLL
jgi:hypothetical protein